MPTGFTIPGWKPPVSPYQTKPKPTGPGGTPYTGEGVPGSSPYVPEEAAAQRQRETTRLMEEQQAQAAADAAAKAAGYESEAAARRAQYAEESEARQAQFGSEAAGRAAGYESEADRRRAGLQTEAEQRRLGYLSQLGAGAGAAPVTHPGLEGSAEAAREASFARAKDRAGSIARASLTSLRNIMGERGVSGSSIEGLRSAGIVGAAGSELGDVNREQLIQDLNRQAEIQDLAYQGGIQQRGQTLAANNPQSLMSLITARGLY